MKQLLRLLITAALSRFHSRTVILLVAVDLQHTGREGEVHNLPVQISLLNSNVGMYF